MKKVLCICVIPAKKKVSFIDTLKDLGRKHIESVKLAEDYITNLPKYLAGQVDAMLLEDEISRIRNERYLNRLALRECACTSSNNYGEFDFDDYDTRQSFFEKQHRVR